ncbi:MAG: Gfo/Idh/MocA family oxidoreductase [Lacunisphaera sp.]
MKKVTIGIMGCGAIAPSYLRNLNSHFSGTVEVLACADALPENAAKIAREFNVPRATTPDELLQDPAVELIINLTPAPAHHEVSLSILRAGKHLFSEKPLALSLEHGRELIALAAARGLRIGGAADTFLGAAGQLARKLVDDGRIGTPIAAQALFGANVFDSERYHRLYRGALLDLGPYYLTAFGEHPRSDHPRQQRGGNPLQGKAASAERPGCRQDVRGRLSDHHQRRRGFCGRHRRLDHRELRPAQLFPARRDLRPEGFDHAERRQPVQRAV